MVDNAPPSINPANLFSLVGLMALQSRKALQYTDDMLPAQVMAYDRTTNRAQVQPLIAMVTTDNQQVNRGQIASVPVVQLGAGGFVISFPVKGGDLGWIKANDRDISLFKQAYANTVPNTGRFHSFEDAVFIPDTMLHGVDIAGGDVNNLVIQNFAGTVKIALSETSIVIDAPTAVTVNTPTATINATSAITFNTPAATFTGSVVIDGDLTVDGSARIDGDSTVGGIPFSTHKHTGVQTGGGDTGGPI